MKDFFRVSSLFYVAANAIKWGETMYGKKNCGIIWDLAKIGIQKIKKNCGQYCIVKYLVLKDFENPEFVKYFRKCQKSDFFKDHIFLETF